MNEDTLKYKTTKALFWSFVEAVGLRGVQFVIGIILARLLLPEVITCPLFGRLERPDCDCALCQGLHAK